MQNTKAWRQVWLEITGNVILGITRCVNTFLSRPSYPCNLISYCKSGNNVTTFHLVTAHCAIVRALKYNGTHLQGRVAQYHQDDWFNDRKKTAKVYKKQCHWHFWSNADAQSSHRGQKADGNSDFGYPPATSAWKYVPAWTRKKPRKINLSLIGNFCGPESVLAQQASSSSVHIKIQTRQ